MWRCRAPAGLQLSREQRRVNLPITESGGVVLNHQPRRMRQVPVPGVRRRPMLVPLRGPLLMSLAGVRVRLLEVRLRCWSQRRSPRISPVYLNEDRGPGRNSHCSEGLLLKGEAFDGASSENEVEAG